MDDTSMQSGDLPKDVINLIEESFAEETMNQPINSRMFVGQRVSRGNEQTTYHTFLGDVIFMEATRKVLIAGVAKYKWVKNYGRPRRGGQIRTEHGEKRFSYLYSDDNKSLRIGFGNHEFNILNVDTNQNVDFNVSFTDRLISFVSLRQIFNGTGQNINTGGYFVVSENSFSLSADNNMVIAFPVTRGTAQNIYHTFSGNVVFSESTRKVVIAGVAKFRFFNGRTNKERESRFSYIYSEENKDLKIIFGNYVFHIPNVVTNENIDFNLSFADRRISFVLRSPIINSSNQKINIGGSFVYE